jgi:predicted dehydrogenase
MKADSHSSTGSLETRRTFIKKSAAAAAAVLASGQLFRSSAHGEAVIGEGVQQPAPRADLAASAGERITLGMIGLGSRGLSNLRAIQSNATESNVVVAAVCDLWDKRVEAGLEQAGLSSDRGFLDYRKLLELADIDAVVISTTDQWHAQMAIDAMNAGKHVYLEKPFTRYLGEAFDVYDTAKRTGLVMQLGTQGASDPTWARCAELVKSGAIGPLVLAQASYMRNSGTKGEWNYRIDPDLKPDSLDWKAWLGPVREREFSADHFFRWRKYYPYCAGITGDLVPHRLSPMLLATGTTEFPSRVVSLGTRAIQLDRDVNDNIQIIAEFPSGFAFHIIGSTVNEQGLPDMIRGHHATLTMGGGRINLNPERPFADDIDPEVIQVERPNTMRAHLQNWYTCIREGGEPIAGPELAIRQQALLALAEMSERMNIMCLFDERTRTIRTGDGRVVEPLSYESEVLA